MRLWFVDASQRFSPMAIIQANETAILFASLWEDQDHVFGTEVEYLIDEHGGWFFIFSMSWYCYQVTHFYSIMDSMYLKPD